MDARDHRLLLATCIVLYDGPLKSTWLAPATMGLCRLLCFLVGGQCCGVGADQCRLQFTEWFPPQVLVAAVGHGHLCDGNHTSVADRNVGGAAFGFGDWRGADVFGKCLLGFVASVCVSGHSMGGRSRQRFPLLIGMIVFSAAGARCAGNQRSSGPTDSAIDSAGFTDADSVFCGFCARGSRTDSRDRGVFLDDSVTVAVSTGSEHLNQHGDRETVC